MSVALATNWLQLIGATPAILRWHLRSGASSERRNRPLRALRTAQVTNGHLPVTLPAMPLRRLRFLSRFLQGEWRGAMLRRNATAGARPCMSRVELNRFAVEGPGQRACLALTD